VLTAPDDLARDGVGGGGHGAVVLVGVGEDLGPAPKADGLQGGGTDPFQPIPCPIGRRSRRGRTHVRGPTFSLSPRCGKTVSARLCCPYDAAAVVSLERMTCAAGETGPGSAFVAHEPTGWGRQAQCAAA